MNKMGFFDLAVKTQEMLVKVVRESDFNDELVDGTLLGMGRVIITRAKTINDLMEFKSYESVGILSRSLFEQYLSLSYILQDRNEVEKRVHSYFYNSRINTLTSMIKLEELSSEKQSLYTLEEISREVPSAKSIKDVKNYYAKEFEKLFDPVMKKWEKKHWYNVNNDGNTSIAKLIENLKIDHSMYVLVYQLGSMDVHGTGIYNNIAGIVDDEVSGLTSAMSVGAAEKLSLIIVLFSLAEELDYYKLLDGEFKKNISFMKHFVDTWKV